MILTDLMIRAVTLRAHYTDDGVLPVSAQLRQWFAGHPGRFSFHMWSGDLRVQILLFVIATVCGLALIAGYRTRLALLSSLVLMISLQNRNTAIETGGDYLLRLICLWALFLPLEARFSLDRRAGRVSSWRPFGGAAGDNEYFSLGTLGLCVQLIVIYYFSALHKSHPIWTREFTAIHYALHIDAYDTSFGEWLRQYPVLTRGFTRGTLFFESVAPWLLVAAGTASLIPKMEEMVSWQSPTRTLVAIAFILFHAGLALSLSLGTFAWFAMMIWLGMFPTWAWDRLVQTRFGRKWAKRIRDWESRQDGAEPSQGGNELSGALAPQGLRRVGYLLAQSLAVVTAILVIMINIETLHREARPYLRGGPGMLQFDLSRPIDFVRLDQHWGLFTPYPRKTDGYYVILATLEDGRELDMLSDDLKLTWKKPADVSESFETFRWRKYFRDIRRGSGRALLRLYSDYQCRTWNEEHSGEERMKRVEIYFMQRDTLPQGGHSPTKKRRLWGQGCRLGSP